MSICPLLGGCGRPSLSLGVRPLICPLSKCPLSQASVPLLGVRPSPRRPSLSWASIPLPGVRPSPRASVSLPGVPLLDVRPLSQVSPLPGRPSISRVSIPLPGIRPSPRSPCPLPSLSRAPVPSPVRPSLPGLDLDLGSWVPGMSGQETWAHRTPQGRGGASIAGQGTEHHVPAGVVVGVHPCPGHLSLSCRLSLLQASIHLLDARPLSRESIPSPRPSPGHLSPLPGLSISQHHHLPGAVPSPGGLNHLSLQTLAVRPSPAPGVLLLSPCATERSPPLAPIVTLVWAPMLPPAPLRGPPGGKRPWTRCWGPVCWPQTLGCPAPRTLLLGGFMPRGCLYVRAGQGWGQWRAPRPLGTACAPWPWLAAPGPHQQPGFAGRVHGYGRAEDTGRGDCSDELKPPRGGSPGVCRHGQAQGRTRRRAQRHEPGGPWPLPASRREVPAAARAGRRAPSRA